MSWILRNRKGGRRALAGRDKSREALGFSVWPQPLFSDSLSSVHSRQNDVLQITDLCPAHSRQTSKVQLLPLPLNPHSSGI